MTLTHKEAMDECSLTLSDLPKSLQTQITQLETQVAEVESAETPDIVKVRNLEHKSAQLANNIFDFDEEEKPEVTPPVTVVIEPIVATEPPPKKGIFNGWFFGN